MNKDNATPSDQDLNRHRQRLSQLRDALLDLHKTVVDSERETYEKTVGRIQSPGHFLQLLTNDPWFAWLQPFSRLVVTMDVALEEEEEGLTVQSVDALIVQTRELLVASESGQGFSGHYYGVLQRDPDVIMAQAKISRLIGRKRGEDEV